MIENVKISPKQLILLVVISRLVITITFFPALEGPPGNQDVWISEALSIPVQLLISVPIYLLWKRFPNQSFIEYSQTILGPEFRQRPYVFISKRKAEDIIRSEHEQEKIPGLAIEKLAKLTSVTSKISEVQLIDLLKNLASKTNDSIIPGIDLVQVRAETNSNNLVKLEGMAILKRDKLIGWFDSKKTRGVLWILGKIKSGIIVVPTPREETKKTGIEIIKATSRIVPERMDGNLVLTINVHVEGNLGEQINNAELVKPEPFKELEEKMTSEIEDEINSAVVQAQKWDVDIFNFGTEVHRHFPKEWPELEKNWRAEFQKLQVNVVVDAKLRWAGFMKQPIQTPSQ
ncbi:MAG TPA: Ger(x)C family spore germination protein [Desulfosporosinus sp.]|nr:Ger(x)C family spore germination protein [Desulfosporosinus sp.]